MKNLDKKMFYCMMLCTIFFTSSATATLIDLDTVTHDDAGGLYWLDVSVTGGLSYNDAATAYYPLGWRHATTSEMNALFALYFPSLGHSDKAADEALIANQLIMGITHCNCDPNDLNDLDANFVYSSLSWEHPAPPRSILQLLLTDIMMMVAPRL